MFWPFQFTRLPPWNFTSAPHTIPWSLIIRPRYRLLTPQPNRIAPSFRILKSSHFYFGFELLIVVKDSGP